MPRSTATSILTLSRLEINVSVLGLTYLRYTQHIRPVRVTVAAWLIDPIDGIVKGPAASDSAGRCQDPFTEMASDHSTIVDEGPRA